MSKKLKVVFWAIIGAQFLILLVLNGVREYRLHAGTIFGGNVILLKTVPVDPRDLLRGDYVTLRYEITNLRGELIKDGSKYERGDAVYVGLRKGNKKYWEPVVVYKYLPDDNSGNVFLKGESIRGINEIRYGIESYFVPEGKGLDIESAARRGEVFVEVAVDTSGNGTIKRLFIGNTPIKF